MCGGLMSNSVVPLASTILSELKEQLSQAGFHRVPREPMFARDQAGRKEIFWLIYTRDPQSAEVSATVAVAFESIEVLMREASGLYHNPGNYTMSLAKDVWRIDPGMQTIIRTADDLPAVIGTLMRAWQEFGLPFYERFKTVRDVAEYMTPSTVGFGNTPINCSVGAIAKRQCGSADYAEFVEFCRGRLKGISDGFYLRRFDALIERLS